MQPTLPTPSYPLAVQIALRAAPALGRDRILVIEDPRDGTISTLALRPYDDLAAQQQRIDAKQDRFGRSSARVVAVLSV